MAEWHFQNLVWAQNLRYGCGMIWIDMVHSSKFGPTKLIMLRQTILSAGNQTWLAGTSSPTYTFLDDFPICNEDI